MHYLATCGRKTVTVQMVIDGAQRERRQVLRVLDKLAADGYLRQVADSPQPNGYKEFGPPRRNPSWLIIADLTERPQPNPPRKNTQRSRVWRAVRAKRCFTKRDLVVTSGAAAPTVDEYVRQLEKHGYVRKVCDLRGRACRDRGAIVYQLVKHRQVEPPAGLFKEGI